MNGMIDDNCANPTPTPKLVPDRPSDVLRELAGSIRSVAKTTADTANRWRNHPDSPGMIQMAGLYDGWADVIDLCADAAAPPAEAPAERGDVVAIMERVERASGAAYAFDDMEPVINHRALREILIAQLAAAPAEPATDTRVTGGREVPEPTQRMIDAFHAGSGLGRFWPEAVNGLRSAMHHDPRFQAANGGDGDYG